MLTELKKFPAPYFGGKAQATDLLWALLGDPAHYVTAFCGSCADLLRRPHPCNRPYHSETANDADGLLCLGADTRLLTADLLWVSAGDVTVDDVLMGFDETNTWYKPKALGAPNHYRRWQTTKVLAVEEIVKPSYRLVFSDGTTLIASDDHQWLGGSHKTNGSPWRWTTTRNMICNRREQRSWVLKLTEVVQQEPTYDAGWLAGFADGEGHIVGSNYGWHASIHQSLGPELEKASRILEKYGFAIRTDIRVPRTGRFTGEEEGKIYQPLGSINITGGMREILRFLMLFRPERLLRKAVEHVHIHSLYGRERQAVALVEKVPLGLHKVIAIETESHTYIAEGLASHNCNALRALAFYPQETAEAASFYISECDLMARHLALLAWVKTQPLEQMMADPHYCDPEKAGWWLWGASAWIGSGWCTGQGPWVIDPDTGRIQRQAGAQSVRRKRPHLGSNGEGVNRPGTREPGVKRQRAHLSNDGQGVNHAGTREPGVWRQRAHLSDNGQGLNRPGTREPGVSRTDAAAPLGALAPYQELIEQDYAATGGFHPLTMPELRRWFAAISARLRHVRIIHGDYTRVLTHGALNTLSVREKKGHVGIFIDPPYTLTERDSNLYRHDATAQRDLAAECRAWCLEHGGTPHYRIVLAGFTGEGHEVLLEHGWREYRWFKQEHLTGGMGNLGGTGQHQQDRERFWASPHCQHETQAVAQMDMFTLG